MNYFTVKKHGKAEIEEKKSVFIGNAYRVESEESAREFLNKIKNENKEARHNVFAYIIGENKGIQRYSDDGEPQGTGGIPVLEVIKKNELTDTIVVVTRYFGGILLGTGGLTRAYTKAAAEAVKNADIVEKVQGCALKIQFDYDLLGKVQYYFEQNKFYIDHIDYSDKVEITHFCEMINFERIISELINLTSARIDYEVFDKGIFFKVENRLFK